MQTNLTYSNCRMASSRLLLTQITEIFNTDKVKTGFEPIKVDDLIEASNWAFNMDTACVESRRPEGSVMAIETLAVEREFAETWLDRRELDHLICNDPAAYAELVFVGDVKGHLDAVRQRQ